jgi:hypothetical protein
VQARVYSRLGLLSIVISCLLWAAILVIPFLPLSPLQKASIATSLVVISEVSFWVGILLAGKELAHRYRRKLNPYYWFQKSRTRDRF